MQGDRIISALIGLVGAVSNNGKTERTDSVVRRIPDQYILCFSIWKVP